MNEIIYNNDNLLITIIIINIFTIDKRLFSRLLLLIQLSARFRLLMPQAMERPAGVETHFATSYQTISQRW